ncbi:TlpA disulfide reductase family protein [Luteimonas sp. TWI662]|uniref:TlpA family protein disulfide reductase n=1 Tax=unclassified Luteimonas TaxID=2629088 RepID=UPI0032080F85
MRASVLVSIALLVACALVVVLGVQNRRLQTTLTDLQTAQQAPPVGAWWPALDLQTLDGRTETLGGAGRAQVIYVFDTGCPACKASVPAVREIARQLHDGPRAIPLVGIGGGRNVAAYPEDAAFDFPVFPQSEKLVSLLGLQQVPLLVAVDHDGRVVFSHAGPLNKDVVASLMTGIRGLDAVSVGSIQGEGR